MPARTGSEYLKGLQAQEREVWIRGERVKDPTTHPGLRNGALAIASWSIALLVSLNPGDVPRLAEASLAVERSAASRWTA